MTSAAPLDGRLYGAAQQLLISRMHGSETPPAAARGLVTEQDAVDAALLLFAVIEEQVRGSRIALETAARMAALLMLIRDHVRPLPPGIAEDGTDLLTRDLAEMVEVVRLVGGIRN
jgi:hypothetical protein